MNKNIIWIQVDSLRSDFLNPASVNSDKNKLFIEKLISKGHYFPNCISSAPYTLASEVSTFTSFYPNVHGVDGWFKTSPNYLKRKTITLTDILKHHNYKTFCIYESAIRGYVPYYGFDEYHMMSHGSDWPLETYKKTSDSKFIFLQFVGIHDDCISFNGKYTVDDYYQSLRRVSSEVETVFNQCYTLGDIVIVASDHGVRCIDELEGQHRENVTGTYLTDKTIKVPFAIIAPELIGSNGVSTSMVRTLDIMPTLLDYLDMDQIPAQGHSLKPLIADGDLTCLKSIAFSQTGGMMTSPWKPDTWSVRSESYKYIYTRRKSLFETIEKEELYDLISDPFETSNIIDQNLDVVHFLKQQLFANFFSEKKSPLDYYLKAGFPYLNYYNSRSLNAAGLNVFIKNIKYMYLTRLKLHFKILAIKFYRIIRGFYKPKSI